LLIFMIYVHDLLYFCSGVATINRKVVFCWGGFGVLLQRSLQNQS